MDDGTPAPKRCSVCGDPLRPDNSIGVCSSNAKPDCAKARRHAYRERREPGSSSYVPVAMDRRCEICGRTLRNYNKSGLCNGKNSPECKRERARRAPKPKPRPKPEAQLCEVCGSRLNRNNTMGICGDPYKPDCRRERKRRQREGMIAGRTEPAIAAGAVYGKWMALETSPIEVQMVLCRCECGTERRILGRNLILGLSRDCGCTWRLEAAGRRWPDAYITAGSVFGRLTALEDVRRASHKARFLCECGTEAVAQAHAVRTGRTRSCGCLRRESITTHGLSNHPLFGTWRGIVDRCTNPKNANWQSYGGRRNPVRICDRWLDPAAFIEDIEREIGPRPEGRYPTGVPLYTIDRIDNDGGYEPGNVKWSTQHEQLINQRKVVSLTEQRDALAAEVERLTRLIGGAPS